MHCGDVYGYHRQVDPVQPTTHPCGKLMESLTTMGFKMPRRSWVRIRKLLQTHPAKIQTFWAHDAQEFEQTSSHSYEKSRCLRE